jgi:putative transposase
MYSIKRAKYPKFKKKGMKDSFRYPQGVKVDSEKHRVYLPTIGWVKYRGHRPIEGIIKHATVSYKAGHWYVSIMVEYEPVPKIHPFPNNHVGLDLGVVKTIATSNGVSYRLPKTIQEIESKIKATQRKIARCVKGSHRRNKLKLKLQKLWCKLSNVRNNFLHQTTTDICKNHAVVVVEDLYVTGMTQSAKGTVTRPGKGVTQKRRLNRNILKQGWGIIVGQLSYKLKWFGGHPLITVNAAYTSQTCAVCGVRDRRSRVKQSVFQCTHCGHTDNADYNAAKVILSKGVPFTQY